MATFTSTATERRTSQDLVPANGPAYDVKSLVATVEMAADATVGTTYDFGNIPSNARILAASKLYWDDIGTNGTKLDIGLAEVGGNLANSDDPDALSNGHVLGSGASSASAISEITDIGKPAWDLVASESSDPGGALTVYGSITDAAVSTGATGSLVLELLYYLD